MIYVPLQPVKGQSFTLQLESSGTTTTPFSYLAISKDGGKFVPTANTPTFTTQADSDVDSVTMGYTTLILTASEMGADRIVVIARRSSSPGPLITLNYCIYTVATKAVTLDLTLPITDVADISSSNPTLGEVLSLPWLIVRKAGNRDTWNLKKILKYFDF